MLCRGRADGFEFVGRGRDNRHAAFFDEIQSDRMRRHANGYVGQAGTGQVDSRVIVAAFEHHGQRSGPEFPGQSHNAFVGPGIGFQKIGFGDVGNQRVEKRALFGFENSGNRRGDINVGAETINGFGRHGDETAAFDGQRRPFKIMFVGLKNVVHGLNLQNVQDCRFNVRIFF